MRRAARRLMPVLVVCALLGVVFVAASLSDPEVTEVPVPTLSPLAPGDSAELPEPEATLPPPGVADEGGDGAGDGADPLGIVTTVLAVIGAAIALWFLLRRTALLRGRSLRVRSHDRVEQDDLGDVDEVADAVQAGIDELDDDAVDPRRAVIACWLRLESAAAAAGVAREPGETSADLVTRMLAGHQVSAGSLQRFATLYRRARYAPDEVAEEMRAEVRIILSQVRAELAAPAAATTSGDSATVTESGHPGDGDRTEGRT